METNKNIDVSLFSSTSDMILSMPYKGGIVLLPLSSIMSPVTSPPFPFPTTPTSSFPLPLVPIPVPFHSQSYVHAHIPGKSIPTSTTMPIPNLMDNSDVCRDRNNGDGERLMELVMPLMPINVLSAQEAGAGAEAGLYHSDVFGSEESEGKGEDHQ